MTVDRKSYIGGADAAAVAGVGLWGSPYSVWAAKVGAIEEDEREVSERMAWGLVLERPLALEWARREGVSGVKSAPFRRLKIAPYVGGHPDFLGVHPVDGNIVIETKLSDRASEWIGPDGEDYVPLQYFLQVQHYLMITGRKVGYLVVLVRGNELRSWRLPEDPEVQSGMMEAYADFWRLVETKTPPEVDGHEATAEALKRLYPRGEETEIVGTMTDVALAEQLIQAKRTLKEEEARKTEIENRLKERMGTATRLLVPGVTVTWRNNKDSEKVNWQALAESLEKAVRPLTRVDSGGGTMTGEQLVDWLRSMYTSTVPGARVFRVAAKSEE